MRFRPLWERMVQVLMVFLLCVNVLLSTANLPVLAEPEQHCEVRGNNNTTECTTIINNNFTESDPDKVEVFASGVIVGGIGGSAATIATVAAAGVVKGLSAAGISSGLAAIGSTVGGGMVAGLAVSAAVPVTSAAAVGLLAYKSWQYFHSHPSPKKSQQLHSTT